MLHFVVGMIMSSYNTVEQALIIVLALTIANYDGDIICNATCGSLLTEVENVCRNSVSSNIVVRQ